MLVGAEGEEKKKSGVVGRIARVRIDKHNSAFGGTHTPSSLYYSLEDSDDSDYNHHSRWLSIIRDAVWQRIYFENDLIPTVDALQLHYKRTLQYWQQCTTNMSRTFHCSKIMAIHTMEKD